MEKQSFSDGLFSPLGIKRVIFMLVLLTTSFISCSNSDEKKEEVWKWHRNIVIWSLTLVEAGRLFR